MATATKPKVDENSAQLDFRDLTPRSGGKGAHVTPGDYLLEVVQAKNVEVQNGANKGKRQIAWQYRIVGTPDEAKEGFGQTVYNNTLIAKDSKGLWFLRNLVEDMLGVEVTGKALNLKLDDKVGKRVGATLGDGNEFTDKEGEQQVRSEIKGTFPAERFVGASSGTKSALNGRAAMPAAEVAQEPAAEDNEDIDELPVEDI